MNQNFLLVFCTCPNTETAEKLATQVVEQRLAACVNVIPGLQSIFRWQEKIENVPEVLLLIKTTASNYAALESFLKDNHPYECPEIIGLPFELGYKGYLQWLNTNV